MRVKKNCNEEMKTSFSDDKVIRFSIDNVFGELQESKVKPSYKDKFNIYLKNVPIIVFNRAEKHRLSCSAHIHLYNSEVKENKEELEGKLQCSMGAKADISEIRPYIGEGVTLIINNSDITGKGTVEINGLELKVSMMSIDFRDPEILKYI